MTGMGTLMPGLGIWSLTGLGSPMITDDVGWGH